MLSRNIVAHCSENKSPDDPVVSILGVVHDGFFYLFYCFGHFAFFEEGEGPVAVAVVGAVRVVELSFVANIYSFRIILMHVVDEG